MKKFWCNHFITLKSLEKGVRQEAAEWAFDRFDPRNIDIFYNGPDGEHGFWFANEKDAMLFALRWGA